MGIFGFLKSFSRKKDGSEDSDSASDYTSALGLSRPSFEPMPTGAMPSQLPPMGQVSAPKPLQMTSEAAMQENMKAKIDLLATQVDSMRIQNDSINEKLIQIERMLKQLVEMARAGRPF